MLFFVYDYYGLAIVDKRVVIFNDDQRHASSPLILYSNVDEALYGIVWYGPLIVAMFTLLSLYMC